jgi:hypothetical protein
MGLRDLFKRWSKDEDERAIERAELRQSGDYEGTKDDIAIKGGFAGSQAMDVVREDLEDR